MPVAIETAYGTYLILGMIGPQELGNSTGSFLGNGCGPTVTRSRSGTNSTDFRLPPRSPPAETPSMKAFRAGYLQAGGQGFEPPRLHCKGFGWSAVCSDPATSVGLARTLAQHVKTPSE
jgi:hypothetical protein